jgi:hypothetical protein
MGTHTACQQTEVSKVNGRYEAKIALVPLGPSSPPFNTGPRYTGYGRLGDFEHRRDDAGFVLEHSGLEVSAFIENFEALPTWK